MCQCDREGVSSVRDCAQNCKGQTCCQHKKVQSCAFGEETTNDNSFLSASRTWKQHPILAAGNPMPAAIHVHTSLSLWETGIHCLVTTKLVLNKTKDIFFLFSFFSFRCAYNHGIRPRLPCTRRRISCPNPYSPSKRLLHSQRSSNQRIAMGKRAVQIKQL